MASLFLFLTVLQCCRLHHEASQSRDAKKPPTAAVGDATMGGWRRRQRRFIRIRRVIVRLIPDDPSREARMVNGAALQEALDRCSQGEDGEVIAHPDGVAFRSGPDDYPGVLYVPSGMYYKPGIDS